MVRRVFLCLVLLSAVLIGTGPARCEVIHGFVELRPTYIASVGLGHDEAFDFLTQTIVLASSPSSDLSYGEDEDGRTELQMRESHGHHVDTALELLEVAPDLPDWFYGPPVLLTGTYVVRTADNLYVKFAVREFNDGLGENDKGCCNLIVEYYVQMDGSPNFDPLLPVRPTTWGKVKALYR